MSSQPIHTRHSTEIIRPADRRMMVAEAAYFRAKDRDFAPGHELEDWLAAEAEIEAHVRHRAQLDLSDR